MPQHLTERLVPMESLEASKGSGNHEIIPFTAALSYA